MEPCVGDAAILDNEIFIVSHIEILSSITLKAKKDDRVITVKEGELEPVSVIWYRPKDGELEPASVVWYKP